MAERGFNKRCSHAVIGAVIGLVVGEVADTLLGVVKV